MSVWELSGLAAVLAGRPGCCAAAVCESCRWAFNPLESPCGSPLCAPCIREDNPERARCLPCAGELQCAVHEPIERMVARVFEQVRGAA